MNKKLSSKLVNTDMNLITTPATSGGPPNDVETISQGIINN